jgi:hypothetical protein
VIKIMNYVFVEERVIIGRKYLIEGDADSGKQDGDSSVGTEVAQ